MPGRFADIADRTTAALNAEAHGAKVARIAELALDMQGDPGGCPIYTLAIRGALEQEPPPFDTEAYEALYRDASVDARWMAVSLITNSEREGDGSRRLWSLAAYARDRDARVQLKRHAVDESRHALMYLALLDLAFPGAVSPDFRVELRQLSPGFSPREELYPVPGSPYAKEPTIDDFVQMNIAEIRTTIHHVMQRAALAVHCPPANRARLKTIQDRLLRDELAHVGYTAAVIERLAGAMADDQVAELFARRFRDFNRITREELGEDAFDCSVACCTKREWCRSKATDRAPAFLDS